MEDSQLQILLLFFWRFKKMDEKNDIKPWPYDIHDAIYCLQALRYAKDSNYIFDEVDFSDELAEALIDWDLITIAKSALYFYLMSNISLRKERNSPLYVKHDWYYITPLLLNKFLSKDVLNMLQLFYFCPDQIVRRGITDALRILLLFSRLQISERSLDTLLIVLNIEENCRELLIKKTFKDKNFDQIIDFVAMQEVLE